LTSIKRSAAVLTLLLAACTHGSVLPNAGQNAAPAAAPAAARATQMFVSPLTVPGKIVVLPATAKGTVTPNRTIDGFIPNFALNYFLAYDAKAKRIWGTACLESGATGGPIVAWPANAAGSKAKPAVVIQGKNTGLSGCQTGIALDSAGDVYVADLISSPPLYPGGQVAIFKSGQHGNAAPSRRIAGTKAVLKSPEGVALDAKGNLYVANSCQGFNPCTSGINIYPPGASGNIAPIATIGGKKTNILAAFGVALDAAGNVYVADAAGAIEIFKAGSTGNVGPVRFIAGDKTQIRTPSGIAVDGAGYIYLGNFDQSTSNNNWPILVFAPTAAGNVPPVQVIRVKSKRFDQPSGIAIR